MPQIVIDVVLAEVPVLVGIAAGMLVSLWFWTNKPEYATVGLFGSLAAMVMALL